MSKFIPYAIAWGVLALVVIVLAMMRKAVASHEDDTVHLTGDAATAVSEQTAIARKLEKIDKWGKLLTVILAVTGVALGGYYAYDVFVSSSSATFK
jgi:hypothetical protein